MNKSYITALFAALLWLAHTPAAFCTDVTGEVSGPNGPVAGAQVTVADSGGNVVGRGTTNDAGRYCIRGITPGEYKTALNPPAGAGLQPGVFTRTVPNEGLMEDWAMSPTTVASSSANSPGVCEGVDLAAAALGTAALFIAAGAGFGACAAFGCFEGAEPPATASK
jgi:hypothetical protein